MNDFKSALEFAEDIGNRARRQETEAQRFLTLLSRFAFFVFVCAFVYSIFKHF